MKAFVISLSKIPASIKTASNVVNYLKNQNIEAELFEGTYGDEAISLIEKEKRTLHPINQNGEENKPNFKVNGPGVIGCFYSHFNLWKKCIELDEPILIFEDDVIFVRNFISVPFEEILIVALGNWPAVYSKNVEDEPIGLPIANTFPGKCLPGAVGYGITPAAAKKLVNEYKNTYTSADSAIRSSIVDIKIHSHLIGRALIESDGKISLTRSKKWIKK